MYKAVSFADHSSFTEWQMLIIMHWYAEDITDNSQSVPSFINRLLMADA